MDGNEDTQRWTRFTRTDFDPSADLDCCAVPIHIEAVKLPIDYGHLDREKDLSKLVMRSIFTWMRDSDGYPASEEPIYHHPWVDLGESNDEDESGNVQKCISTEIKLNQAMPVRTWILKVKIARSRSI